MRNPTDNQAAAGALPDAEARAKAAEAALDTQFRQQHALSQGLAHDLRAPLRAIDSFAVLAGQHASGIDDAGRDYLQRIRDSAARMGTMLDSLQELSSAGRAPLRFEQVELSMLAEWVGAELQDAHPGRAAQIQVRPGLAVQGDEHDLKRMLSQLLDAAWQFCA